MTVWCGRIGVCPFSQKKEPSSANMKIQPLEFEKPVLELEQQLTELRRQSKANDLDFEQEVQRMEAKIEETKREIYQNLTEIGRAHV